jgi:acylphosphatase
MTAWHIRVEGRVQGVGFRYFTQECALRFGLVGWCRNRRDGSVEIFLQGDAAALSQSLGELQKGPLLAQVSGLQKRPVPPQLNLRGFTVQSTA